MAKLFISFSIKAHSHFPCLFRIGKVTKEIEKITTEITEQKNKYGKMVRSLVDAYKDFEKDFEAEMKDTFGKSYERLKDA